MKRNDILIITAIIVVLFGFWIFMYNRQNKIQNSILKKGKYNVAIINEESAAKGGSRDFYSFFIINNKKFKVGYTSVSQEFYKSHQVGDTIIIKFLPNEPDKSMIIEDKKYKTCYGLPPAEGWQELPECE